MNKRQSRLLLICGLIVLATQLGLAAPVKWEQNGHSYEVIVSGTISWPAAQAAAEAKGGYLATITSAEENQFVFNLTVNTPGAWHYSAEWAIGPWIGGSDAANEGNWQWVTGEPWGYTNWLNGQPDNWQDEDYLMFWGLWNIMPTWNDGDIADAYVIEYEPPTVEIQFGFNNTIFISKPISHSPFFQIDTLTSPPGGSFKWEIISGQDKIKFLSAAEGELADHVLIQGTAPSNPNEMYGDVGIKVTYTIDSQVAEDSIYISVVKPSSLSIYLREPPVAYGNGGYMVSYHFQVLDQKGMPLTHKMYATETRRKVSPNSIKRLKDLFYQSPLESGGAETNWNGILLDEVGLNYSVPNDFISRVEQQIYVEGWHVGTRCQIYHATDAESLVGPCP